MLSQPMLSAARKGRMFGTERLDTHSFGMEFQNTIELWYRTAIVASRSNHQRMGWGRKKTTLPLKEKPQPSWTVNCCEPTRNLRKTDLTAVICGCKDSKIIECDLPGSQPKDHFLDFDMGGQVPNPRIITACLEELENILKVGEVEKNLDNSMDVNYYAQLIHETEGFKKIENLQSLDDDEIYGKWVEILLGHKNAATVSQETSIAKLQYKSL